MELYDKNGNGTIEFDEFKSIVSTFDHPKFKLLLMLQVGTQCHITSLTCMVTNACM